MSVNWRSLPQNNAPFGVDQLAKFSVSARNCVPIIRALYLLTEGTIRKRRPRGTCWHPAWMSKWSENGGVMLSSRGSFTLDRRRQLRVHAIVSPAVQIVGGYLFNERKREREK